MYCPSACAATATVFTSFRTRTDNWFCLLWKQIYKQLFDETNNLSVLCCKKFPERQWSFMPSSRGNMNWPFILNPYLWVGCAGTFFKIIREPYVVLPWSLLYTGTEMCASNRCIVFCRYLCSYWMLLHIWVKHAVIMALPLIIHTTYADEVLI